MSAKVYAIVKPELLRWARETAGFSVEEAAKKADITHRLLLDCERGKTRLTINQLRKLSTIYKRPLALFYLPEAPQSEESLRDFRRLTGEIEVSESPALRLEIRRAVHRRQVAIEMYRELGLNPTRFSARASISEEPEVVGIRIRELLKITLERQSSLKSSYEALGVWRMAIESTGILVFQSASVSTDEMRGFSISEFPLPVIVVNNKDAVLSRVFSMLHELTHIMLRDGGLCNLEETAKKPEERQTEVFCNAVAGAVLVPKQALLENEIVAQRRSDNSWDDSTISSIAHKFSVNREVLLRRLLTHKLISQTFYQTKREIYRREFEERPESKGGVVTPDVKAISSAGKTFVRLVLDSYQQDKITPSEVSEYLGVRLKHIGKIENAVQNLNIEVRTAA